MEMNKKKKRELLSFVNINACINKWLAPSHHIINKKNVCFQQKLKCIKYALYSNRTMFLSSSFFFFLLQGVEFCTKSLLLFVAHVKVERILIGLWLLHICDHLRILLRDSVLIAVATYWIWHFDWVQAVNVFAFYANPDPTHIFSTGESLKYWIFTTIHYAECALFCKQINPQIGQRPLNPIHSTQNILAKEFNEFFRSYFDFEVFFLFVFLHMNFFIVLLIFRSVSSLDRPIRETARCRVMAIEFRANEKFTKSLGERIRMRQQERQKCGKNLLIKTNKFTIKRQILSSIGFALKFFCCKTLVGDFLTFFFWYQDAGRLLIFSNVMTNTYHFLREKHMEIVHFPIFLFACFSRVWISSKPGLPIFDFCLANILFRTGIRKPKGNFPQINLISFHFGWLRLDETIATIHEPQCKKKLKLAVIIVACMSRQIIIIKLKFERYYKWVLLPLLLVVVVFCPSAENRKPVLCFFFFFSPLLALYVLLEEKEEESKSRWNEEKEGREKNE